MNWFRLKACAKCKGDLVLDDGDWLCLQCGTYCYTGLYRNQEISRWPRENRPAPRKEKTQVLAQSTSGPSACGRAPTATRSTHHLSRQPAPAGTCASPVVRFSVAAATR